VIRRSILSYERVHAYAFNQQIPGPRIELVQGDRARIRVRNNLPESTRVHWHGLVVRTAATAPPRSPRIRSSRATSYTYEFTARQVGTFLYHTHDHPDRQQALGLYGALIIRPNDPASPRAYAVDHDVTIQLQEWLEREGFTYPAMLMEGGLANFFTING
jgi:FtsP/CotA-like multicopper oxidase with cupredoxin domain